MLSKVSLLFQHRVVKNFVALLSVNSFAYLIPLITFPYIIRVVGVEIYGQIVFAKAVITYFVIITDYGFDLSATKSISINKNSTLKLSEIFSSVLIIKAVLSCICLLILCILILLIPKFRENTPLLLASFLMVLSNVLMPRWFFQGVEEMGYITILDLSAKFLFASLLFFFVKTANDFLLVPIFTESGSIISSLIGLFIVNKKFHISPTFVAISVLKRELYDGWHIFTSRIFLNLYITTNVVFLSFLSNPTTVGQYGIAEQINGLIERLFSVANQALYPYLVVKFHQSKNNVNILFVRFLILSVASATFFAFLLYFFADPIVSFFSDSNHHQEIKVLLLILILSLPGRSIGPLATNVLIATGKTRQFQKIMFWGALINVVFVIPSIWMWQAVGLASTKVIISIFLTICSIRAIFKNS